MRHQEERMHRRVSQENQGQRTHTPIAQARGSRADPRRRNGDLAAGISFSSGEDGEDSENFLRMGRDMGSDGTTYGGTRDPPGQSSVYIMSGNHASENYRTATFANYPRDVPVYTAELAGAGFYYTGFKDRVKCFSCGMAVENWMLGDNVGDARWHKSDCEMMNGTDTRNIPSYASTRISHLKRFLCGISPQSHQGTSSSSFHSHESCSYRSARISSITTNTSIAVTDACNVARPENEETVLQLAHISSRGHEQHLLTKNLLMESDRRLTFMKWPCYPAPFLPAALAEEGFFYLGNLDRVQCFSCSGVLRNWGATDNVKEQHRKHFPNCRIVRGFERRNIPMSREERHKANENDRARIIGNRQAQSLKEPPDPSVEEAGYLAQYFPCMEPVNPHMHSEEARFSTFDLRWPNRVKATPREIAKAGFFFLGERDRAKCWYCNGGLQNWEDDDEPWTEHAKWFPGCEWLLRRKGVDFVRGTVERNPNLNRPAIRNPASHDIPPMPAVQHVQVVTGPAIAVAVGDRSRQRDTVAAGPNGKLRGASRESSPTETRTDSELAAMVEELQGSGLCKKCKSATADNICIPCGHLAYCNGCATANTRCAVCGLKPESVMRIYRA